MNDPTKEPRTPDSLLISLKELRQIENHRITTEQQERERLEREQRLAAEEAARQARQEAERQRRLRLEHEQSQRDAADREERLRLAEAERRARVEAELQLERERIELRLASGAGQQQRSSAWGTISIVLVVLLSGGLALSGYELHKSSGLRQVSDQQLANLQKLKIERSSAERALSRAQAKLRDQGVQIKLLQTRIKGLSLPAGFSDRPKRPSRHPSRRVPPKTSKPLVNVVKCNPNDPICGIMEPQKGQHKSLYGIAPYGIVGALSGPRPFGRSVHGHHFSILP